VIRQLKQIIDKTLSNGLAIEQNHDKIYELCKEKIREYEKENKMMLGVREYQDFINYITSRLSL
jgi:hypothetical protein